MGNTENGMMTLVERGMTKPPLDLVRDQKGHPDIIDEDFWSLVPLVYDYTELSIAVLYNLYCATRYIAESGVDGDFVECGVHMGGSIMMIEHVLMKYDRSGSRRVFALDTFQGFVRRTDDLDVDIISGRQVCHPEKKPFDYGAASVNNMKSVGFERLVVIKGDVLETIPMMDVKQIALLRLDTDTYDTTKFELEQLYGKVSSGGVVIVDDYGYTRGCKKAVDDFISSKPVLLQRINRLCRAWVKAT